MKTQIGEVVIETHLAWAKRVLQRKWFGDGAKAEAATTVGEVFRGKALKKKLYIQWRELNDGEMKLKCKLTLDMDYAVSGRLVWDKPIPKKNIWDYCGMLRKKSGLFRTSNSEQKNTAFFFSFETESLFWELFGIYLKIKRDHFTLLNQLKKLMIHQINHLK